MRSQERYQDYAACTAPAELPACIAPMTRDNTWLVCDDDSHPSSVGVGPGWRDIVKHSYSSRISMLTSALILGRIFIIWKNWYCGYKTFGTVPVTITTQLAKGRQKSEHLIFPITLLRLKCVCLDIPNPIFKRGFQIDANLLTTVFDLTFFCPLNGTWTKEKFI